METWFIPYAKEIGIPAFVAMIFIWYYIRVVFPEQKKLMVDTVTVLTSQYEQALEKAHSFYEKVLDKSQGFNEKMLKEITTNNTEVHNNLNKRLDGVVHELIDFKTEISKRLDEATGKIKINKA